MSTMPSAGIVNAAKDASLAVGQVSREIFLRFCFSFLTVFGLLWLAVLMYLGFYYAYIPTVRHVKPVHLQFESDCTDKAADDLKVCSFPEAKVSLSKGERMLMRGQKYQVFLDLEMPNSPVNEKLGMFMVKMAFLSDSGKVLAHSERPGMFHYKSGLLKTLSTVFFSLPMIMGLSEEKQVVQLRLFEDYLEDSYHPAVAISVTVFSRQIEIYSSAIRIEACFSGLRYIMFNWPVGSAAVAIASNFLVICFFYFLAYGTFTPETLYNEDAAAMSRDAAPQTAAVQQRQLRTERPKLWTRLTSSCQNGRLRVKRRHAHCKLGAAASSASPQKCCHSECCRGGMLRSATFPPYRWDDQSAESLGKVSDQATCPISRGCSRECCAGRLEWVQTCLSPGGRFTFGPASSYQSSRARSKNSADARRRRNLKRQRMMYLSDPETERSRGTPLYNSTRSLSDQGEGVEVLRYDAVSYCNSKRKPANTTCHVTSSSLSSSPERTNYCCVHSSHNSVRSGQGRVFSESPESVGNQSAPSLSGCRSLSFNTTGSFSVSEGTCEASVTGPPELNGRKVPDGAPSTNDRPSSTAVTLVNGPANHVTHVMHESASDVRRRSANRARARFGLSLRNMLPSKKK